MSDREKATVLAALREWQSRLRLSGFQNVIRVCYNEIFEDLVPLSSEEIDTLCEAINTKDS